MGKSEKIITAVLTMVLGVLLMVLRDDFIGILMTVMGLGLIALGVVDIVHDKIPTAVVKIVVGALMIVCGWTIIEAVLYIVAGLVLICGFLLLYDKLKKHVVCERLF